MIEAISPTVTVCGPGPMEIRHRQSEGVKWCFACRGRHEFEYHVLVPTTEEGWYWGPAPQIVCTSCGAANGDLFPGHEREWEE